ncbi:MAG: ROK family protein [Spirochaetales bacterium]|nr:ROK family protein [Spirochaetales bacterium]
MSKLIIGIDIGGTKCAVVFGNTVPEILDRIEFPTDSGSGSDQAIEKIEIAVKDFLDQIGDEKIGAIGISCGGPLDSKKGVILSPPNLPGWDNIPIVSILEKKFGIPVALQNDANACALAEWKWGAGRGTSNMIFLTFGTGLGAGLILDGRLYSGTNDMAGEVGHVRLEKDGPVGYGKRGSFEGFCSGGGIALLAKEKLQICNNKSSAFFIKFSEDKMVTARDVCEFASKGDSVALDILKESGKRLGMGLSMLIDILNPERIVIGSVFARCRDYLEPAAQAVIQKEALGAARKVCSVVPAALGKSIGDFASLGVALNALDNS